VALLEAAVLLFYTDGPEAACRRLAKAMLDDGIQDDVAIVAVRRSGCADAAPSRVNAP
jgi:hypothetical protein